MTDTPIDLEAQFEHGVTQQTQAYQFQQAPDGSWLFQCDEWLDLSAILTSLPLPVAGTPEGWRLVPVEPTPEMAEAGAKIGNWTTPWTAKRIWADMLAAAPAPEGKAEPPQIPEKLDRRIGDAVLAAMWPSGEIIYDEAFSGPEEQLSAGYAALRRAISTPPGAP